MGMSGIFHKGCKGLWKRQGNILKASEWPPDSTYWEDSVNGVSKKSLRTKGSNVHST